MSEVMTDEEYELVQSHVIAVTLRFCALFGSKEQRITPPMIWAPANNKTPAKSKARAAIGFTLRCTVGRDHERVSKGLCPWTVYPGGIPIGGARERFSYPKIAEFVGGKDHTLFVAAIARLRKDNQELVDKISDTHTTELAKDVALFIALEEQWKHMEEAKAAARAESDALMNSQAEANVDEPALSG